MAPGSPDLAAFAAAVVTGAGDAIMGFDGSGVILLWNDGCEQLFGWTADEMIGRTPEVLLPEGRRDELLRVLHALAGAPEPAALETERIHRSGEVRAVSCRISAVRDAGGQVIGASAVVRDNSRELELRRQLDQARHLAEARFAQSVVPQATIAPDGVLLEVNDALCRLSGHEAKDLLGRPVIHFVPEADVEAVTTELAGLVAGQISYSQVPRLLRRADGRLVETRVSVFPLKDDVTGQVLRLEAVIEDVSAAAAAERELQLREARWHSMSQHSSDVALFCDVDARLLFVSSSVTSVFGYSPDHLLEADGWSFLHPDDVPGVRAVWDATASAPVGTSSTFEVRIRHADGSWRWVEESVTNQLDDPAVGAIVVNLVDVSARKAAEAVLEELAGVDTLTGLSTRAPLMAAVDAAFAAGVSASTALVVLDVARMKLINDTYGHRLGDELLAEVGARLRAAASPQHVVARLGGDRFAVLLHDVHDIADVFETGASLLTTLQAPLVLSAQELTIEAAVGAALGPALESGALLASAESALETAKAGVAGPLHVVRAESASAALSRARVVEDLRRGLERDELVVHFQPVVSLSDGRPVGAEALVRWLHPDKGLLGPGAFLDAAEASGLIVALGERVLQEACRAAARWAHVNGNHRPFYVAVNLSARQLTRGGIVDVVRAALAETGAAPAHLMLEVTESAVMSDVDAAVGTLQQLRGLGVGIALDDFGTGYSSLTYLKRFPVTALKIDRSFVSGLGSNGDDAAIVTSVVNLARAMQLDCVAEGVETEQQRLVLQALGCAHAQGFLWSPALETSACEAWLGVTPAGRAASARRAAAHTGPVPTQVANSSPDVVTRIEELHASGASYVTIAAALNADEHLTTHGRRWSAHSVASELSRRVQPQRGVPEAEQPRTGDVEG